MSKKQPRNNAFTEAGEEKPLSLPREFCLFIVENKKWWLIPILLVLSLLAVFAALLSSPAAPLIYPFF